MNRNAFVHTLDSVGLTFASVHLMFKAFIESVETWLLKTG